MAKLLKNLQDSFLAGFLRLYEKSLKWEVKNKPLPKAEPLIYAFWHRNLIYCGLHRLGDPVAVMISASKDGELISGPTEKLGYVAVRGSSSRRGAEALRGMLRLAKTHSLAITPDGPRGPIGAIHPGLWQLAILSKIPVVGVNCEANREWVFNSWDRFRFPKPFARVQMRYSEPIFLKTKDDIPTAEKALRDFYASGV